jgi:hypothetical protein
MSTINENRLIFSVAEVEQLDATNETARSGQEFLASVCKVLGVSRGLKEERRSGRSRQHEDQPA